MVFQDHAAPFYKIQEVLKDMLTLHEPQPFLVESWSHPEGGGGRSMIVEKGQMFDKAGVNFSDVWAKSLPPSATAARPELQNKTFRATGVSIVVHPHNPYVPTSHFNVRLFQSVDAQNQPFWWIGGGFDLTPFYPFEEDCILWHRAAKKACDLYGKALYSRFKKNCDEYFYLPHRKEARGIGGIFFDDFNELPLETSLAFIDSVAEAYHNAYHTILERRKSHPFGQREKDFQALRRGRYVEFNLLYDRGTRFGLQSQGRIESILMSLPLTSTWRYNWQPEDGSPEARLYTDFLPPQDWADQ